MRAFQCENWSAEVATVGILDYGSGNIENVVRAFRAIGARVQLVIESQKVSQCSHLVLPGVGSFDYGMRGLENSRFDEEIWRAAERSTPILGICLGMQLFADHGREGGENAGLGLFGGQVSHLGDPKTRNRPQKIPHTGWSQISWTEGGDSRQLFQLRAAYFSHSFHVIPDSTTEVLATVEVSGKNIVAVAKRGSVLGAQFHPEKSGAGGLRFLEHWLRLSTTPGIPT